MNEGADGTVGRYQIAVIGKAGAVLLDTMTGSSWSLARDIDTLQLSWRPLDKRWPGTVLQHGSDLPPSLPSDELIAEAGMGEESAAWWRPRTGSKWPRSRHPRT